MPDNNMCGEGGGGTEENKTISQGKLDTSIDVVGIIRGWRQSQCSPSAENAWGKHYSTDEIKIYAKWVILFYI